MFKTFKTKDKEAEKEIIITEGSGCGTVGTSGRFRQQMSAVRIQSSADIYIEHLLTVLKRRKKEKKRLVMAHLTK